MRQTGGRFIAPAKQFILLEDWDPEEDGELDTSKVVTENLMGKEEKGVWKRKGRKGVYDFQEYQDSAVQERENVHNSREDGPFSEEALKRKRKAVMDQVAEGSMARDKVALEGSEMTMQGLLQKLQNSGLRVSESQDPKTSDSGPVEGAKSSSDSESGGNSSSAEEEAGLTGFFGPAAAKAKAKTVQPSQPASSSGRKASPAAAVSAPPAKAQKCSQQEAKMQTGEGSTLLADGRAARAFKNLQEKVSEWTASLGGISIDDEPSPPDSQSQLAFKNSCLKRAADLKNLGRQAREYHKRMDKSSNKDAFAEPLAKLQQLDAACTAFSSMFSLVHQSSTSPEAFAKAFEEAESKVGAFEPQMLGAAFQLKYAMSKASLSCLYGGYDKFCAEFFQSSQAMGKLSDILGADRLEKLVVPEVESRILMTLRAIKPEDVNALATGQEIANINDVLSLTSAIISASRDHGWKFLPRSLQESCELARNLLSLEYIAATTLAVETCEQLREDSGEGKALSDGGAVAAFFLEHAVGRSVLDLATGRVKTGEKEASAAAAFKDCDAEVARLKAASVPTPQGVKLVGYLSPVQHAIDKCTKEAQSLKGSKGDGNAKLLVKTNQKFQSALVAQKKSFSELAKELLLAELKANLSQHLSLAVSFLT